MSEDYLVSNDGFRTNTLARRTSTKCAFLFLKEHVKFERMIKSVSFEVFSIACYIFFPSFAKFVNIPRPFVATHSHLRMNRSAAQQVRDPSTQTSGNRKEPSLVSKSRGIELLG